MGIEALVLESYKSVRDMFGEVHQAYRGPPLQPDLGYEAPVMAENLAGLLGFPGRDLGDGRAIDAEVLPSPPCATDRAEDEKPGGQEENFGESRLEPVR
jgi:hypothetical protein